MMSAPTYLYFAYGSNLLSSRIHTSTPNATRAGIGRIRDFRLDFDVYSPLWRGCPATATPHVGAEVWGALWAVSAEDIARLDKQEKVPQKLYFRAEVEVELADGTKRNCFIYQHVQTPTFYPLRELPEDRRPSYTYLKLIIDGAKESGLPESYLKLLQEVPNNGEDFQPDFNNMTGTFLYFAYGSNLLTRRIHINNPSAIRAGTAKLKNYRLDFEIFSNRWHGCSATVTPHEGLDVWGALWEISLDHLASLDQQESTDINLYFRSEVEVELLDLSKKRCFVYQHVKIPEFVDLKVLPNDRQPSLVYMKTIIEGAIESNLPEEYQKFLRGIAHNGNDDPVDFQQI